MSGHTFADEASCCSGLAIARCDYCLLTVARGASIVWATCGGAGWVAMTGPRSRLTRVRSAHSAADAGSRTGITTTLSTCQASGGPVGLSGDPVGPVESQASS